MNQRFLWNTVALLTTALGMQLSSYAEPSQAMKPSEENRQATSTQLPTAQPTDVIKVGEYQASASRANESLIAKVQPHELGGRPCATLYVRDIPVLTFFGSGPVAASRVKVGVVGDNDDRANTEVWRATSVAARLNRLSQERVDASQLTASWEAGGNPNTATSSTRNGRYLIKFKDEPLVEVNSETQLPDTTNDLAKDALQATNRLRRLLGNAPPLHEISGRPVPQLKLPLKLPREISLGPVRISFSGFASWYGPEFQGNQSASGETFNQNALTAAHRSLPFGTRVRVTNLLTGRSVVVRINDRGPYIHGRIIDLSTAAARLLGLIQFGVAPVHLDVISHNTPSLKRQATVRLAPTKG